MANEKEIERLNVLYESLEQQKKLKEKELNILEEEQTRIYSKLIKLINEK